MTTNVKNPHIKVILASVKALWMRRLLYPAGRRSLEKLRIRGIMGEEADLEVSAIAAHKSRDERRREILKLSSCKVQASE